MTDNLRTQETQDMQPAANTSSDNRTDTSTCRRGMMGCGMGQQGLKGMLLMAACCGAPLLILLVLPLMGTALGGVGASALSTLAYLACPIGMVLMMWMMMRGQQAEAPEAVQAQPDRSRQETRETSEPQPEAPVLQDTPNTNEAVGLPSTRDQVDLITPPRRDNGQEPVPPAVTSNGSQAAVPTPEYNDSLPATSARA
jgi:hypothetical protein